MSFSILEIVRAPVSDAYKADPSILDESIAATLKVEGCLGSWSGLEVEDPNFIFLVEAWSTKDEYDAFRNSPQFEASRKTVLSAFSGPSDVSFVIYPITVTQPLDAPATEFITFSLKEGKSRTQGASMETLLALISEFGGYIGTCKVAHGIGGGPLVENQKVIYGLLGWDSVKAHWDTVAQEPFAGTLGKMKALSDFWLVHAQLKKH